MTTPDILALMNELKKLVIAVEKISEVLCKPVITVNQPKWNPQGKGERVSPYDCSVTLAERGGHAKKR